MTSLYVWMDARHIATITESRGKMKLAYVAGVATLGFPLISVSMPMSSVSYTDKVVRPFFHGLLPEGPARQTIAYDFGVAERDDVGLLAAIGRDCAGALIVLPEGDHPVVESGAPELLDDYTILEPSDRINRAKVKPGLTGPWQISTMGSQPLHLHPELDNRFVEKASLASDIRIILITGATEFAKKPLEPRHLESRLAW